MFFLLFCNQNHSIVIFHPLKEILLHFIFPTKQKMVTPLEKLFSTDENAIAQADVQLLGKTVEPLVVEFDQEKFKEFLSSGSASLKARRQYRKVSSETRSRISSEISPKVARTTAHNASGATSEEVLKISRVAHAARVNVP